MLNAADSGALLFISSSYAELIRREWLINYLQIYRRWRTRTERWNEMESVREGAFAQQRNWHGVMFIWCHSSFHCNTFAPIIISCCALRASVPMDTSDNEGWQWQYGKRAIRLEMPRCDGINFPRFLGPARGSRSLIAAHRLVFHFRSEEGRAEGECVTPSLAHTPPLTCQANVTDGGTKCRMCRRRDAAEDRTERRSGAAAECLPPDDRFITVALHTHWWAIYQRIFSA